ncbi:MAG: hypothetical protein QOJ26_1918 [Thermoplasmata archaeon]|jgi:hypothetical protein|nr:hypothetical protein [Thermoplasmata archaeon]MEA3167034.1 hypothetical protein [Thermoplasmata archaeon]
MPAGARAAHEPFLRRLRHAGRNPAAFKVGRARTWFYLGIAALAFLAIVPIVAPGWSTVTERVATLLSLVFLMAAIGLWMDMRGRAFVVATAFVLLLYALTFWTRLAYDLQDFFVLAVLVSFAVFALAGFNLVFVLEEIVYDAHVRVHLKSRLWELGPTALCMVIAVGLPAWDLYGGPKMTALWIASVAGSLLLLFWWTVAWANRIRSPLVLQELHLFVIGALAATTLADGFHRLNAATHLPSLVPSLIAYLVLIGSWVYASYTTLQRTHFLLKGENWRPWVSILLGASFAILAHSQVLVASSGAKAVADLVDLRITWLVAGVWLGIAFYGARGLSRVFRFVEATGGLDRRSQAIAHGAERVAEGLAGTERALGGAAVAVFRRIDTVLPGGPPAQRTAQAGTKPDERTKAERPDGPKP